MRVNLTIEAESPPVLTEQQDLLWRSLPAVLDDPLSLGTGLAVAGSAQLIAFKFQRQAHPHTGHLKSHRTITQKYNNVQMHTNIHLSLIQVAVNGYQEFISHSADEEVEDIWLKECLTIKLQVQLVSGG